MPHVIAMKMDTAEWKRMRGKIERAGGTMRPVMKQIGVWMLKSVEKTFKVRGRPAKWRPLSPMTLALRKWQATNPNAKPKRAYSEKILERSGDLRHHWEDRVTKEKLEFGSSVKYAGLHQKGGKVTFQGRWKQAHTFKVPRRVLVSIHGEDMTAARRIAQDYLNEITRR